MKTNDSYQNLLRKVCAGADAGLLGFHRAPVNEVQLADAYRAHGVSASIVDAVAQDMTRAGIDLIDLDPEVSSVIQGTMVRTACWDRLGDMIRLGRLFGGAIAVYDCGPDVDYSQAFRPSAVKQKSFAGLRVYDRSEVEPSTDVVDGGIHDGLPVSYTINASTVTGMASRTIHHTWVIRHVPVPLPRKQAVTEKMWGDSVLAKSWGLLRDCDRAMGQISDLVDQARCQTAKIKGLREAFAASPNSPAERNLTRMWEWISLTRSTNGITLVDSEDELRGDTYSYAGLSDLFEILMQSVAGNYQIPLTRLMGQSPGGLNSTGESDWRNYYDGIVAQQEGHLRLALTQLISVIAMSETGKVVTSDFRFRPLWQMTPQQAVEVATKELDLILKAYEAGLIDLPSAMREAKTRGLLPTITAETIAAAEMDAPIPGESDE